MCGFFIHKWRSTTFPKAYFRIFKKKNHVDFFSTNDAPRRSRKTNFRISCGFFFHKWRSTIYPVCGFFFHNLQIGVNRVLFGLPNKYKSIYFANTGKVRKIFIGQFLQMIADLGYVSDIWSEIYSRIWEPVSHSVPIEEVSA